jgi:hypothetical protein
MKRKWCMTICLFPHLRLGVSWKKPDIVDLGVLTIKFRLHELEIKVGIILFFNGTIFLKTVFFFLGGSQVPRPQAC